MNFKFSYQIRGPWKYQMYHILVSTQFVVQAAVQSSFLSVFRTISRLHTSIFSFWFRYRSHVSTWSTLFGTCYTSCRPLFHDGPVDGLQCIIIMHSVSTYANEYRLLALKKSHSHSALNTSWGPARSRR